MSARMLLLSVSTMRAPRTGRGHVDLLHQLAAGIMAETLEMAGAYIPRRRGHRSDRACDQSASAARRNHPCRGGERRRDRRRRARSLRASAKPPISPRLFEPCSSVCFASVQPMVPLRSATTLFGTPALISDCVPMIERVRPAQFTTMVVSGSGAALAGAQHQLGAGHADRARDVHGGVFVEAADVEDGDIGAGGNQRWRRRRPAATACAGGAPPVRQRLWRRN